VEKQIKENNTYYFIIMEYYEDLLELVYDDYEKNNNYTQDTQATQEMKKTIIHNKNQPVTYTKKINNVFNNKFYNLVKVQYYLSGSVGSNIINALTGTVTPYKVGSMYEDLFFVVKPPKSSTKLFYETPEQYENSHYVLLQEQTKKKWRDKYDTFIKTHHTH
jgi:hypothetical protein